MSPRSIAVAGLCFATLFFLAMFASRFFRPHPRRPCTLDEIALPCLRLTDSTGWELLHERRQLSIMSSGRFLHRRADPLIVDARLRVFETSNATMKQSALGLMFSGPRMLDITYDLHECTDRTPNDAKRLIIEFVATSHDEDPGKLAEQVGPWEDLPAIVKQLDRPLSRSLDPADEHDAAPDEATRHPNPAAPDQDAPNQDAPVQGSPNPDAPAPTSPDPAAHE